MARAKLSVSKHIWNQFVSKFSWKCCTQKWNVTFMSLPLGWVFILWTTISLKTIFPGATSQWSAEQWNLVSFSLSSHITCHKPYYIWYKDAADARYDKRNKVWSFTQASSLWTAMTATSSSPAVGFPSFPLSRSHFHTFTFTLSLFPLRS